jgi:hypothetical protein
MARDAAACACAVQLAGKPVVRLLLSVARHHCVLLLPLVCAVVCRLLVSCMAWQRTYVARSHVV